MIIFWTPNFSPDKMIKGWKAFLLWYAILTASYIQLNGVFNYIQKDELFLAFSLSLSDDVKFRSLASSKFQDVRDLSRRSDECHVPAENGVTESRIA